MHNTHSFHQPKGLDLARTFGDNPLWGFFFFASRQGNRFAMVGAQRFLKWWISHFGIKLNLVKRLHYKYTQGGNLEYNISEGFVTRPCGCVQHADGTERRGRYGRGDTLKVIETLWAEGGKEGGREEGREGRREGGQEATSVKLFFSIKPICSHIHPITKDQRHVSGAFSWLDF